VVCAKGRLIKDPALLIKISTLFGLALKKQPY
jgi:hypothetical protein